MKDWQRDFTGYREIHDLALAQLTGEADDAQSARLEELVSSDPAACRLYFEIIQEAEALRTWAGAGATGVSPVPAGGTGVSPVHGQDARATQRSPILGFLSHLPEDINWRVHPVRFFTVAALLTVATWVGFYFYIRPALLRDREVAERPGEKLLPFVAKLRYAVDVQWGGNQAMAPIIGSHLRQGQFLDLKSGLAEIRFKSGANVILEGPAEFTLDDENAGELRIGRLAARVSDEAKGFTINTSRLTIVDVGTEFGVEVEEESGITDVQVFVGEVEVERTDGAGAGPKQRLRAGQAIRFDPANPDGPLVAKKSDPAKFIRPTRDPSDPEDLPPLPITRGLALWLAADVGVVPDTQGRVFGWKDLLVGDNRLAHHAKQQDATSRPRWVGDAINGMPALRFDGSDSLAVASPSSMAIRNCDYEVFIVARSSSDATQFLVAGGTANYELHVNHYDERLGVRFISNPVSIQGQASDLGAPGQFTDGVAHVFTARVDRNNGFRGVVGVDGAESGNLSRDDARSQDNTALRLGRRADGTFGWQGEIAEVMIYSVTLLPEERSQIVSYLAQKYQLRAGPGISRGGP